MLNVAPHVKEHCGAYFPDVKCSDPLYIRNHIHIIEEFGVSNLESIRHHQLKLASCDELWRLLIVSRSYLQPHLGLLLIELALEQLV